MTAGEKDPETLPEPRVLDSEDIFEELRKTFRTLEDMTDLSAFAWRVEDDGVLTEKYCQRLKDVARIADMERDRLDDLHARDDAGAIELDIHSARMGLAVIRHLAEHEAELGGTLQFLDPTEAREGLWMLTRAYHRWTTTMLGMMLRQEFEAGEQ